MGTKAEANFSIRNTTKGKPPRLPFVRMKDFGLGKEYSLSLVFVGDTLSKNLNRMYRGKNKPTDILSFSLNKKEGEIFINLKKARTNSKKFNRNFENFVGYLFIHGLMHLKGFEHSSKMDSEEEKIRKVFSI
jgi:probable rRNA maturation factor